MFECKMYPIFRQTLVYILHTKCIQNVYNMFVYKMYSTFQKNFACQMYTKCLHKTSIPHFHKRLQTFCMQNLAGIVFLILYTKCIQKFVERWYTFCIQFVYIQYRSVYTSRTFFVYQMYTQFPCGKNSETKNTTYQYTRKYQG